MPSVSALSPLRSRGRPVKIRPPPSVASGASTVRPSPYYACCADVLAARVGCSGLEGTAAQGFSGEFGGFGVMASATRTRSRSQSGSRSGGAGRSRVRSSSSSRPGGRQAPTSSQGVFAPHPESRSGRGGSFAVQRMVLLEIAGAFVVCGWLAGTVVLIAAIAVAAMLLALAVVRRRGRSMPEWLGTLLALRTRSRRLASTPVPPGTDSGLAPAVECDPTLRTYNY